MDVRVSGQGNGTTAVVPVAAVPVAPADSRALMMEIASAPYPPQVKTQMVAAVAAVDGGIADAAMRSDVMAQISGLGMYLKTSANEGWPRWNLLTALRTYGLSLEAQKAAAPKHTQDVVVRRVQAQLESIARSERGVSMEQVASVMKTAAAPKGDKGTELVA